MFNPNIKLVIGEKVVLVEDGINSGRYSARSGQEYKSHESEIATVGRKYFYVRHPYRSYNPIKFSKETGREVTDYTATYSLHKSWEEYLEERDVIKLNCNLNQLFKGYNVKLYNRSQVERVLEILNEGEPEESV